MNPRSNSVFGPLSTLHRLGGYYACPKTDDGQRLGPLVGYAGRYQDQDGTMKQYVGDVYANWAVVENRPTELDKMAKELLEQLDGSLNEGYDVFCGAPLGGLSLAFLMAMKSLRRYVAAEKKVIAAATPTSRERATLFFGRHELHPGDRVVLVEDVLNNFSTAAELLALISSAGGQPVATTALMDRSLLQPTVFPAAANGVPVVALVRGALPQYRQDDPAVAADVAAGNVVWKPKMEWPRLMAAMAAQP